MDAALIRRHHCVLEALFDSKIRAFKWDVYGGEDATQISLFL